MSPHRRLPPHLCETYRYLYLLSCSSRGPWWTLQRGWFPWTRMPTRLMITPHLHPPRCPTLTARWLSVGFSRLAPRGDHAPCYQVTCDSALTPPPHARPLVSALPHAASARSTLILHRMQVLAAPLPASTYHTCANSTILALHADAPSRACAYAIRAAVQGLTNPPLNRGTYPSGTYPGHQNHQTLLTSLDAFSMREMSAEELQREGRCVLKS
jgi:hypothetical protein